MFNKIKIIYTAFSIADTVTYIQNTGHSEDWDTLNLIYDSTVLMRLLGTSGELLKKATFEMHTMLLDMGCRAFYFDHTLAEVFSNIDALISRYSNGDPIHRETAQALENNETSMSRINLLKGNADVSLGSLNITQIDIPPRIQQAIHQVNPLELEDFLKSKINYRHNSVAASIDAESIEKVIFLRRGKRSHDLPKCNYIFVTHNALYARVSRDYSKLHCNYSNFDTPPIVTLNNLTKLAWLACDKNNPNYDLSKNLLASCFQASLPDDKWYNKFWKTIEETHPELLDEDIHESLYLLDVRNLAEDKSLGNSALFDDIDFTVLIANAKLASLEREQLHKEKLLQNQKDSERALSKKNSLMESERNEFRLQKLAAEEKAKADLAFATDELELINDIERKKIKEAHDIDTHASIQDAKSEMLTSITKKIDLKAKRNAKRVSFAISLLLALSFVWIFIVSISDSPPVWIPLDYMPIINKIAIALGVIQIIGLFIENFSLLFLGPIFEKHLATFLRKHYRKEISIDEEI